MAARELSGGGLNTFNRMHTCQPVAKDCFLFFLTVSGCCFVFVTYLLLIYLFRDWLFFFMCCSFACVEPSKPATALNYAARLLLKRLKIPARQGQRCAFSFPLLCATY